MIRLRTIQIVSVRCRSRDWWGPVTTNYSEGIYPPIVVFGDVEIRSSPVDKH